MPLPTDKPKRRRWLPRWSLATMFIGITIVCVWFGLLSQSAKEQKRAVESLRAIDGVTILYDYEVLSMYGYSEQLPEAEVSPPGPAWLRDLIGVDYFANVVYVRCFQSRIRDDALRHLWHFRKLKLLHLMGCHNITDVGLEHLTRLTSLTELELWGEKLTKLPTEIGKLTKLRHLNLGANRFNTIPPGIGHLTSLTHLDIRHNQLTALPPEIGKLTKLTELKLHGNKLTTLPPEIGELTDLTVLYLLGNQLTTLPPEFGKLTNLQELLLYNNRLTKLPSAIGKLQNLTQLRLHHNRLTQDDVADLKWALPNCTIRSDF